MAVTEDVIRLVLETKGAGSIEDLQQNLAYTQATLGQLKAAYNAGEIATDEFLRTGAKLARQEQELVDVLGAVEQAERAATIATKQATVEAERAAIAAGKQAAGLDKVDAAAGKAKGGVAGFGQSALQAGRVIQDFTQGGIGGILNNIEGLSMALGGGAGLAGVLTILGVGFAVFKPQIEEFFKSFSNGIEPVKDFTGGIEALEAKIKELTEKPHKLSVDIQQLENAKEQIDAIKKGLAALEAAKSGRTEDEKAAGDKFSKEFAETGGEGKAALEAVQREVGDAAVAGDPAVRAERKALADRLRSEAGRRKAQKEAEDRATTAMNLPGADPGYVAQLAAEAESLKKEADAFVDPAAMKRLRDNIKQASDKAREKSDAEVGKNFADVQKGNNPIARDVMAERFRAAGQDKFAGMVEQATPERAAREAEIDHQAEKDEEAFQASVVTIKARMKRQRDAEKERLRLAEAAGKAAEQDPAFKRRQAEIDRTHKGFGLREDDAETVRLGVQKQERAEAVREAKAGHSDKILTPQQQQHGQRERQQEGLARQIFQGSPQMAGAQFTPDQSRDAAKATLELMGQGANFNTALQSAMMQEMQAMQAMAAKFQQQQAQMMQLANGFGQINREIRQPANWNGNGMGGD